MTEEAANAQLQSFDSNAMPWGELYIDQLKLGVPLKAFISDPDTGMVEPHEQSDHHKG